MGRFDPETRADIERRFRFHPGTAITGPKHDEVRAKFLLLALWILDDIPPGRERIEALRELQAAMMWTNAAVAIRTEREPLLATLLDRA